VHTSVEASATGYQRPGARNSETGCYSVGARERAWLSAVMVRSNLGLLARYGAAYWRRLATSAGSAASADANSAVAATKQLTGVAGRYAGSLLRVAMKANQLNEVHRDVDALERLLRENPRIEEFLRDPTRSQVAKQRALEKLLDAAGVQTVFVRRLLDLLADNRRLSHVSQVLHSFQSVIAAQRGSTQAVVTSAVPLTEWQLALLRQRLQRRFYPDMPDARVDLITRIDRDLIGGFTVQLGDKFMDLSLKSEVRRLRDELAQQV
jgi:ATP synthase F1 delta subunit